MYYSRYHLEQLKLEPSDLEPLSEDEQIQKIRLQWMSLCLQASDEHAAEQYTYYYHQLISPYYFRTTDSINRYFVRQDLRISHTTFDLSQREQIQKSYNRLLTEFSQLSTEIEKQNFVDHHVPFFNLAQSLLNNQKNFNQFLGQYLYLQKKKTLQMLITQQWRMQMIRLFGIEGLDDFQYRHALATGELRSILAKDKLCSPIRCLVGVINSLILLITTTFEFILSYHVFLRMGFFFLLSHPLAILMVQLSRISLILEMFACPTQQIIRPVCAYTQWSPQTITVLLTATALAVFYGVLYTTMLAKLTTMLPYISLAIFAYFLYFMGKQCMDMFRKSFADGLTFTATIVMLFSLQAYIGLTLNPRQTLTPPQSLSVATQWLRMFSLFSLVILLTKGPQGLAVTVDMLPLPLPNESIPEIVRDTMRLSCNTANLSHRFFNTPKDAPAISRTQIEENSRSVWCWAS